MKSMQLPVSECTYSAAIPQQDKRLGLSYNNADVGMVILDIKRNDTLDNTSPKRFEDERCSRERHATGGASRLPLLPRPLSRPSSASFSSIVSSGAELESLAFPNSTTLTSSLPSNRQWPPSCGYALLGMRLEVHLQVLAKLILDRPDRRRRRCASTSSSTSTSMCSISSRTVSTSALRRARGPWPGP
jgi:hypothetical protein